MTTDVTVAAFEVLQGQLRTKDEQIKMKDEQLLVFAKALLALGLDPAKVKDMEGEVARLKATLEDKEKQIAWLAREPVGLAPSRTSYIFTFEKSDSGRIQLNENHRQATCIKGGQNYVTLHSAAPIPPGSARSCFSVRYTKADIRRQGILLGLVPKFHGQKERDAASGVALFTGDGVMRREDGVLTYARLPEWKGAWAFNKTGDACLVQAGGLVEFDIDLKNNLVYITIVNGERVVTSTVVGHFNTPLPQGVDLYPSVSLGYEGQTAWFE